MGFEDWLDKAGGFLEKAFDAIGEVSYKIWEFSGFSREEATRWMKNGVSTPDEASEWVREGFTPEQAGKLKRKGFTIEDVRRNN